MTSIERLLQMANEASDLLKEQGVSLCDLRGQSITKHLREVDVICAQLHAINEPTIFLSDDDRRELRRLVAGIVAEAAQIATRLDLFER